ncbi:hypothetical protein THIOKS1630015 [Thiocapsa sp. KS1]|nr:hypothetical protein THIOKS1630015 [Thiocapsa sp. KS1]
MYCESSKDALVADREGLTLPAVLH